MTTLALSFLTGSSLFLLVTRTSITSRTRSKFGQIGLKSVDLAALERLEKSSLTYDGKKCCDHSSPFIFDCIILILAGDEDMH